MNLSFLLQRTAARYSGETAIIDNEDRISYGELWQEIENLSKAFTSIGIQPHSRVALLLPNSKEFIYSFFALLYIRAVAVPLKCRTTRWELERIFETAMPQALILTPRLLNSLLQDRPSLLQGRTLIIREEKTEVTILDQEGVLDRTPIYTIKDLQVRGRDVPSGSGKRDPTRFRQPATIHYTYRGFGYPVGAMLTHANFIHGVLNYIRHRKSSHTETVLLVLPSSHIFPLMGCILVPLLVGAEVVILRSHSTHKIFKAISANHVNILVLVPTLYAALLRNYDPGSHDISSLKYGITGGSLMQPELNRRIKEKMGLDVIQGYGLTECMPVTCNPVTGNRPETLGLPLNNVRIKVVDEKGRACEIDEIGEILIKSPQTMTGYYQNQPDTNRVLKDGWLYTGDYGRVDQAGYLYFEGVKKGIVNVGGNNVDLAELKNRILSVEGIEEAVFDMQEDEIWGQKINAAVTVAENSSGVTEKALLQVLRAHLSPYKVPNKVTVVS